MSQRTFNPINYGFEFVGDWYTFSYKAAHLAARRARDKAAREAAKSGRQICKYSWPNSLITKGGIGTGHPQIEEVVTVYVLDESV